MPPPILNDSEDEDDVVVYDDSKDSLSRFSGESAPEIPALDGTRDTQNQSTGSTERLKRQINDAQWSLCKDSSERPGLNDTNPADAALENPTLKRDKRRHSIVQTTHPESTVSTVKRAKTTTTYSTKKPTSSSLEREKFLATFGQDAIAPNTSPSVRFSDHSGAGGSSGLPVGSMPYDFINHEPAMFKESGSTVADNESSHERMVEQALRSKSNKATSSPGIKLVGSDDIARSSSFPWSAPEQTELTRSRRGKDVQVPAVETGEKTNTSSHHLEQEEHHRHEPHTTVMPSIDEEAIPGPATAVMVAPSNTVGVPRSSPTVEITRSDMKAPALPESVLAVAEKTQKSSRGRKRKVQDESSEPLNSDDIAVGLPKERYKPRPSRRRATQASEEPIDYSVVPEKAMKSKRSKTVGSSFDAPEHQPQVAGKRSSPSPAPKAKPANEIDADAGAMTSDKSPHDRSIIELAAEAPKPSPVVELPRPVQSQPSQVTPKAEVTPASQTSNKVPQDDDPVFVKPAPKLKPASKSKRSSTTIFEDHVDFTGKSRSPSLSQQQAIRQSALRDVKNEASPVRPRRGGKHVILDDDDEEDELSLDPFANVQEVQPEEPPKKRGRGRPSKGAAKASAKTPAKPTKQSKHDDLEFEDDQVAVEEPPKKRRGRPPKSAAAVQDRDDGKELENPNTDSLKPDEEEAHVKQSIEQPTEEITPAKKTATKIPTPSPEKQPTAEKVEAPQKSTKVSPTTHSPIKSSSPAMHRVGLSKKHRIPSLLRVMRPPPPKRG